MRSQRISYLSCFSQLVTSLLFPLFKQFNLENFFDLSLLKSLGEFEQQEFLLLGTYYAHSLPGGRGLDRQSSEFEDLLFDLKYLPHLLTWDRVNIRKLNRKKLVCCCEVFGLPSGCLSLTLASATCTLSFQMAISLSSLTDGEVEEREGRNVIMKPC